MRSKDLSISVLFDQYGALLTERQSELVDLYYNEDLSLSEISENTGITRQGVRDGIKKAEIALKEFEEKLGVCQRKREREEKLEQLKNLLSDPDEKALENAIVMIDTLLMQ